MKSKLARARDAFMKSEQGQRCSNAETLPSASGAAYVYLRNRLEAAFIAGWTACEELEEKGGD